MTPDGQMRWLTDIPGHWRVVPSKWLFGESKKRSQPGDQQLSATQAYGVIPQAEFERREGRRVVHVHLHLDKRKHVEVDDFVISMRSFQGGLERSWATGSIRSSYVVLHPSREVHAPFFGHLFKSTAYIQALQATSNFIRDGQDLNFNNFALVNLPLVPVQEQRAIADFLNRKTAAIDALIEKKERLLALMAEKRAALIHHANLDSRTVLVRLDTIVNLVKRPVSRCVEQEYAPLGLFNRGRGIFHKEVTAACDLGDSDFYWVARGDLILSGQFAWEGAVALASEQESGCVVTHRYPILLSRCEETLRTVYLYALLRTQFGDFLLNENSRGAAGRNRPLNIRSLMKERISVPPIAEQERVVQLAITELNVRARVQKFCDTLREYRQALVTAAVTGQLDIPETAA